MSNLNQTFILYFYEENNIKGSISFDVSKFHKCNTKICDLEGFGVVGIHHVGFFCENLERSLHFYQDILGEFLLLQCDKLTILLHLQKNVKNFHVSQIGLPINEARPHDKLPFRGAWIWVGADMIHLSELPNPDPLTGRPEPDRHACIAIRDLSKLKDILDKAGNL